MTDTDQIIEQLSPMTDLEWFDKICNILRKENNPTTQRLNSIIGTEKPNPKNEIRGSKFLDTYDKRFIEAYISPNLTPNDSDQPLDYLGFLGYTFKIKIGDIIERFANYRTITNCYDGGTQIFFYPIPNEFEFTAIDCWTEKEENEILDLKELEVKSVTFMFGDRLIQGQDGLAMSRE
jgi:hypothetical protein